MVRRPEDVEKCAHCGSPIVDRSTIVERGDKLYCCRNCEAAMEQSEVPSPALS
jgi:hypothetical protein